MGMKVEPDRIRATAAAYKILQELGFPHPREFDLKDLAMNRNVFVREGEMKGAEGRLLRKKRMASFTSARASPPRGAGDSRSPTNWATGSFTKNILSFFATRRT